MFNRCFHDGMLYKYSMFTEYSTAQVQQIKYNFLFNLFIYLLLLNSPTNFKGLS